MRRAQRGQALVAALVTMALLFALAGGLAMAVSATLNAQGPSTSTYLRDTGALSATEAIVSTVAGSAGAGSGCPTGALADFPGVTAYGCDEVDYVRPGQVAITGLAWSGGCGIARLGGGGRLTAWLNSVQTLSGTAPVYIDGSSSGCSPGAGACVGSGSTAGPGHFYRVPDCSLSAFATPYLHVNGPAGSVRVARTAPVAAFLPAPTVALGRTGVAPIAAAALRGAGAATDLVVGDVWGDVFVLLGRGDGTFQVKPLWGVTGDVKSLAVADLGNGHPDIVVLSATRRSIGVLVGDGQGNFSLRPEVSLGLDASSEPVALTVGDFNSDGKPDVAVASSEGTEGQVTVLGGDGQGGLANPVTCLAGDPPTAIATADFGSSGTYLAVATTDAGSGEVAIFPAMHGSNPCSPWNPVNTYGGWGATGTLVAGHFQRTSAPDLAVALPQEGAIGVLLGTSKGGYFAPKTVQVPGVTPAALAAANFGSGALADLAISDANANTVSAYLTSGNGSFSPIPGGPLATGSSPLGVAAGAFDGSGSDGIATANSGAGTVTVLLPNHSKVFSVLAASPDGGTFNEADLAWAAGPAPANSLVYEGGLQ